MSETPSVETSPPATALETIGKKSSSIKSIVAALMAIVGVVAGALGYMSQFETKVDAAKVNAKLEAQQARVEEINTRVVRVETKTDEISDIKRDLRVLLEQSIETARRVGARVVPVPPKREP
jgi:methyl-accepting chemotaxis protein